MSNQCVHRAQPTQSIVSTAAAALSLLGCLHWHLDLPQESWMVVMRLLEGLCQAVRCPVGGCLLACNLIPYQVAQKHQDLQSPSAPSTEGLLRKHSLCMNVGPCVCGLLSCTLHLSCVRLCRRAVRVASVLIHWPSCMCMHAHAYMRCIKLSLV